MRNTHTLPRQVVFSNILPALPILTSSEFDKRHSRHIKEWFTFFVLSMLWCYLGGDSFCH